MTRSPHTMPDTPLSLQQAMSFRKTWRPYQLRVLADIDTYLADNRVHVIAAPGSGKTVIGLEIIRRLDRPVLILAPTITIRDQWITRLVESFLPDGTERPTWVSTSLRAPAFVTVATYQALYSLCSGKPEADATDDFDDEEEHEPVAETCTAEQIDCHALLKSAGVSVLVVDEAHHLHANWWNALTALKEQLGTPVVIALTATPPYDIPPQEWEKYQSLCGPIDVEVSVPELVKVDNLCPHQDYLYMNAPTDDEQAQVSAFRRQVADFIAGLEVNDDFTQAIAMHPWMAAPEQAMEAILNEPGVFTSMAVFLQHRHGSVSRSVLHILGMPAKRLPTLSHAWLEELLTAVLFTHADEYASAAAVMQDIRHQLERIGAVERRAVLLHSTTRLQKTLSASVNKLNSIVDIVRLESSALQERLRMVILTDYIRKAAMPKDPQDRTPLQAIGIVPIFEALRRAELPRIALGVLSGSLVIIPVAAQALVRQLAGERGIDSRSISCTPLPHDPNYCLLELTGQSRQGIVDLVTRLFERGGVTVLVGTKSLLGEGWDAPCINTLILATVVGSYMLSNQMRGRAIRVHPGSPDKTANIWHLICVEEGESFPSDDYAGMTRRFEAFMGVSFTEDIIETGIRRMHLPPLPYHRADIEDSNRRMAAAALDREALRARWARSLVGEGVAGRVSEEVRVVPTALPTRVVYRATLRAILYQGMTLAGFVVAQIGEGVLRQSERLSLGALLGTVAVLAGVFAAVCLPFTLRALWLFLKHNTVESSMRQVGEALLHALARSGRLRSDPSSLRVESWNGQEGEVYCTLHGGTTHEQSLFLSALRELLDPVDNPRYLLVRRGLFYGIRQEDYHAVPQVLGAKKEWAEHFAAMWRARVGGMHLVYTRNPEGRALLLRARRHALSASFLSRAQRLSCWR